MPAVAWGVDAASKISVDTLRQQGASFICCYLAPYPAQGWKMRTPNEWREYLNSGFKIVANWESDGLPGNGFGDGAAAAKTSQQFLHDRGCDNAVVYFTAADKDPAAINLGTLKSYIDGAVSVLGWDRVGAYGGFGAIKYLADANACKYYWQTYAWSQGQWDPRAQLRQWKNTQTIDFDQAWAQDFGQYPRVGAPAPTPGVVIPGTPAPAPRPAALISDAQKLEELHNQLCKAWDNPGPPAGPGNGWPVEMIASTHKQLSELNASLAAMVPIYQAIKDSYTKIEGDIAQIKGAMNLPSN